MAMGIVTDEDFHKELGNCSNSKENPPPNKTAVIVPSPSKGRGEGNVEVPSGLRKLIGQESVSNGRQSALELAESLGISPSSVSAYAQGANSTTSYRDRPNLSVINEAKERISKKARNRLLLALNHITGDKLESAKVNEVASVAKDMSAIIKNMEPEREANKSDDKNGPTFVFYCPQFRKEEHFDVIDVKE